MATNRADRIVPPKRDSERASPTRGQGRFRTRTP